MKTLDDQQPQKKADVWLCIIASLQHGASTTNTPRQAAEGADRFISYT